MTDAPVPPHSLDAEETVLGAMMLAQSAVDAVQDVLKPDGSEFWRESHGCMYRSMLALVARGIPVDALTVADQLDKDGTLTEAGGIGKVQEIASLVPAEANAAHYARIVAEMATLRGLIAAGTAIVRLGWDRPGETGELVDQAEQMVFSLAHARVRSELAPVGVDLDDTWRQLEQLAKDGRTVIGVPSGLAELDRLTSGFQPGNLIVVGARPAMGKSGLVSTIAAHVALRVGSPVALFTLEMTRREIHHRLIAAEARVDLLKLRNGSLDSNDWASVTRTMGVLADAPLFVEDNSAITMLELRSQARKFAARHPDLALVIVDYLQLLSLGAKAENRTQEVSQLSRSLKLLAGELGVPVIALSQLNRQVEQRHDKRPLMSDLRESGSVEADADVIILMFRDEVYAPEDAEMDGTAGVCELNIAKHRNGPTDMVKVAFLAKHASFGNLAPRHLYSV